MNRCVCQTDGLGHPAPPCTPFSSQFVHKSKHESQFEELQNPVVFRFVPGVDFGNWKRASGHTLFYLELVNFIVILERSARVPRTSITAGMAALQQSPETVTSKVSTGASKKMYQARPQTVAFSKQNGIGRFAPQAWTACVEA